MRKKKLVIAMLMAASIGGLRAQSYSVRTNIIGLASTNLNIEASMAIDRKWSIHLPVQYNPFVFKGNKQFRNIYVSPGVRYWLLESYFGGFIGFHGTGGIYSVGNLFGNKYRYEGSGFGAGISIGKAYQLGKNWNFEWEIGYGATWLNYEKYECKRCGDLVVRKHGWFLRPTKAALNIVYLF